LETSECLDERAAFNPESGKNKCSKQLIFIPYSGKFLIAVSCNWIEPKTDFKEKEETATTVRQMHVCSW
jgi:hypothetical protein